MTTASRSLGVAYRYTHKPLNTLRVKLLLHQFSLVLLTTFSVICHNSAQAQDLAFLPSPYFQISLNLNEFSILNVSSMDGVLKYGGSTEFSFQLAKHSSNEVTWTTTVRSPKLMELLPVYLGERTLELVRSMDSSNPSTSERLALASIRSLAHKLEQARAHPNWELKNFDGLMVLQTNGWKLHVRGRQLALRSFDLADIAPVNGMRVKASGFIKEDGILDVTRIVPKLTNTLEVFVMSFCPYAQHSEKALTDYVLNKCKTSPKPRLEFRYIFYRKSSVEPKSWSSLHGAREIEENLVQIGIRDKFKDHLLLYIASRARDVDTPWTSIAAKIGLSPEQVEIVQKYTDSHREELMQQEYAYAVGRYGITDGSPTFAWESERIHDLRDAPPFEELEISTVEKCND